MWQQWTTILIKLLQVYLGSFSKKKIINKLYKKYIILERNQDIHSKEYYN
jgi:hypothetical protein